MADPWSIKAQRFIYTSGGLSDGSSPYGTITIVCVETFKGYDIISVVSETRSEDKRYHIVNGMGSSSATAGGAGASKINHKENTAYKPIKVAVTGGRKVRPHTGASPEELAEEVVMQPMSSEIAVGTINVIFGTNTSSAAWSRIASIIPSLPDNVQRRNGVMIPVDFVATPEFLRQLRTMGSQLGILGLSQDQAQQWLNTAITLTAAGTLQLRVARIGIAPTGSNANRTLLTGNVPDLVNQGLNLELSPEAAAIVPQFADEREESNEEVFARLRKEQSKSYGSEGEYAKSASQYHVDTYRESGSRAYQKMLQARKMTSPSYSPGHYEASSPISMSTGGAMFLPYEGGGNWGGTQSFDATIGAWLA